MEPARRLVGWAWGRRPGLLLIAVLVGAIVEMTVLSWLQVTGYWAFWTSAGDLGTYNQAFFTTLNDQRFFYYTVNLPAGTGGNLFAVHFVPFFILLLPFYALAPGPAALLVIKNVAIALGALPLYGLARDRLGSQRWGALIAFVYLLSPLTMSLDWNSFDPEAFIPLTFLTAFYFLNRGKLIPFAVAWVIALSVMETAAPLLILFAITGLLGTFFLQGKPTPVAVRRERFLLSVAAALAILWFVGSYFYLVVVGPLGGAFSDTYATRYTVLGATSITNVFSVAATHPALAGAALHYDGSLKVFYLVAIFGFLAFLPLLGGPRYLLPLFGWVGLALLSNSQSFYLIGAEYPGFVIPFVFGALVGGIALANRIGGAIVRGVAPAPPRLVPIPMAPRDDLSRIRDLLGEIRARGSQPNSVSARKFLDAVRKKEFSRAAQLIDLVAVELGIPVPAAMVPISGGVPPGVGIARSPPSYPNLPGGSNLTRTGRYAAASRRRIVRGHGVAYSIAAILVIAVLVSIDLSSPLMDHPKGTVPWNQYGLATVSTHDQLLHSIVGMIPPTASVFTVARLFPEVSNRPNAYVLPLKGYIAGNVTYQSVMNNYVNESSYILADFTISPHDSGFLLYFSNLSRFQVQAIADGAYLYSRSWVGPPELFVPTTYVFPASELTHAAATLSVNGNSPYGKTLQYSGGGKATGLLWTGPHAVFIPPGVYSVSFWLRIVPNASDPQLTLRVDRVPLEIIVTPTILTPGGHHDGFSMAGDPAQTQVLKELPVQGGTPGIPIVQNFTLTIDWRGRGFMDCAGLIISPSVRLILYAVTLTETSA